MAKQNMAINCKYIVVGLAGLMMASAPLFAAEPPSDFEKQMRQAVGAMPAESEVATSPAKPAPPLIAVAGKPVLMIGSDVLTIHDYQMEEFFLSGTAQSYKLAGAATADGNWQAIADATAPFTTRFVVLKPSDPGKFNGTVLVEWLNVTAGQDTPADFMLAHREMLRRGYGYVAVSAQKVGVEGGDAIMAQGMSLKKANPARYASLSHPGDAFSFDIFSQVGAVLKAAGGKGALGALVPKHFVAIGESQSAAFLTTYVNAVDPLARVYDGFFVHSRFGGGAAITGSRMGLTAKDLPDHVQFRADLRVPVLCLITETDLLGARLAGYHASRRADYSHLRVWEIPGAAHADNYLFGGAMMDNGSKTSAQLAKIFLPTKVSMVGKSSVPFNPGMPHHYTVQAAIAAINGWVSSGKAPVSMAPMVLASGGKAGVSPNLSLDTNGLAKGGVRTPWVDVPTLMLSGKGDPNSFIGMLAGSGVPFDAAKLAKLYPAGKAEYLRKFTTALDRAISRGHILREDRQEILDIAALNYDGK
jgi:hypothetical protein